MYIETPPTNFAKKNYVEGKKCRKEEGRKCGIEEREGRKLMTEGNSFIFGLSPSNPHPPIDPLAEWGIIRRAASKL